MITLEEIIRQAIEAKASDIFILAGQPVMFKCGSIFEKRDFAPDKLTPAETEQLMRAAYAGAGRAVEKLKDGDDHFALSLPGISRVRVGAYKQRSSYGMNIKMIPFGVPTAEELQIPETVTAATEYHGGLVIVCGGHETGRSTTLACLLDRINAARSCHIVTLEKPIEYLLKNNTAFVSQRELDEDTGDMYEAIRASRRLAPDVLMVSSVPDRKCADLLFEAAENYKLVFICLKAKSSAAAVKRLLSLYEGDDRKIAAKRLAHLLKIIVCQELAESADGGRVPAFEVMPNTDKTAELITGGKYNTLLDFVNDDKCGCVSMNSALAKLYADKKISAETALYHTENAPDMRRRISAVDKIDAKETKKSSREELEDEVRARIQDTRAGLEDEVKSLKDMREELEAEMKAIREKSDALDSEIRSRLKEMKK